MKLLPHPEAFETRTAIIPDKTGRSSLYGSVLVQPLSRTLYGTAPRRKASGDALFDLYAFFPGVVPGLLLRKDFCIKHGDHVNMEEQALSLHVASAEDFLDALDRCVLNGHLIPAYYLEFVRYLSEEHWLRYSVPLGAIEGAAICGR